MAKKKKKTQQNSSEPVWFRFRRHLWFTGKLLVVLTVITAAVFLGYRLHYFLVRSPYFRLTTVTIPGVSGELREEILEYAGLDNLNVKNYNLLKLRTNNLTSRISGMPKLHGVWVYKDYPSTLKILVHTRKPSVIVSGDGLYLADLEGMIMEPLTPEIRKEYDFPIITGLPGEKVRPGNRIEEETFFKALDIQSAFLRHSGRLYDKLSELNLNARGEITAVFDGGTEIRFGRKEPLKRLPELEAFLNKYASRHNGLENFRYVDLRIRKQIVYALRGEKEAVER